MSALLPPSGILVYTAEYLMQFFPLPRPLALIAQVMEQPLQPPRLYPPLSSSFTPLIEITHIFLFVSTILGCNGNLRVSEHFPQIMFYKSSALISSGYYLKGACCIFEICIPSGGILDESVKSAFRNKLFSGTFCSPCYTGYL